jgi:hypothetical protein
VEDFLTNLKELLGPSKSYDYEIWKDDINVLVGEEWNTEIHEAIKDCDLGLLLVSPQFLTSKYITREELAKFVKNQVKPIIPVLLNAVDFERHDLKGLERHQIFALDHTGSRLSYSDSRGKKGDFVKELFCQLEERIRKLREEGAFTSTSTLGETT